MNDFGHIPEYKPRPQLPTEYVAVGVIVKKGEVLVSLRRRGLFLAGHWEFPGGKREPGESYKQCVIREVLEETGLHINVLKELLPVRHDYADRRVVLQPYLCEVASGEVISPEGQEHRWVSPSMLPRLRMPDANAQLVLRLLESSDLQDPE